VLRLEKSGEFGYYFIMNRSFYSTVLGFLALVFWSTSIAFSRGVTEKIGTLNTAFFNLLFSGVLLFAVQWLIYRKKFIPGIKRLPFDYFYKVGIFMAVYMAVFYGAVGEAVSREAVIVVGIINYLWPGLIFLFSVPLLKQRASYRWLVPGILIAFMGTVMALLEGNRVSVSDLQATLRGNMFPYLLALAAAVSWGLYSNLARRFKMAGDVISVPLIFIISSAFILVLQLIRGEFPRVSLSGWEYMEFGYLVIFPTALAYLFWQKAMSEGNKDLVAAFSYMVPLVSTLVSGIYLDVRIGPGFWAAALMVLFGAVLCRKSIKGEKLV